MTQKSDHLIERAAARLKPSNASNSVSSLVTHHSKGDIDADPSVSSTLDHDTEASPKAVGALGRQLSAGAVQAVSDLQASSKQSAIDIAALERAGLMVARLNRTRTSEEYRIVIGRLLHVLHQDQDAGTDRRSEGSANAVMVTSARPGEGKSFTSLNLGGSIAQNAGESVLIVDVDAKQNSLSDNLELSGQKGFLDLVADSTLAVDDLIVPSAIRNLSFLPIGTRPSVGGNDLVDARRLIPPIQLLARRFPRTLILLDAPPCLSTSDPHTLAPGVGQVVLVVEAERTQRNEVEAAIEMVRACPTITMLLNKVRLNSSQSFGTYDYFGTYN